MTDDDVPAVDPVPAPSRSRDAGAPDVGWPDAAHTDTVGITIAAAQLHVADLVEQDGALQRVTSLRLQGAPPTVSVALTGVPGRRSFPPDARLLVVRGR